MNTIALASSNPHKIQELRAILSPLNVKLSSPKDLGIEDFSPIEDGASFSENSAIKSQALYQVSHLPSLADDSGLIVDGLDGEPGIYSARYGGDELTDRDRAELVLKRMEGITNRRARFYACLSFTDSHGTRFFTGEVEGEIGNEYKVGNGFGYDPIFFYPKYSKYFSELTPIEKNAVSHRGRALEKFLEFLKNYSN